MTKTTSVFFRVLATLAIFAIFALAVGAYADTVDLRGRGSTGRTIQPPPPPPSPAPAPAPTPPPPPSGGISSMTVGSVNSGGNTGGNVTTGNEHVEVHEINIGPTNPPPPPPPTPTPTPTPPPSSDCDGRARTGCDISGRTR